MPGLRDSALALAPPWLSDTDPVGPQDPTGGVGGRLVYLLGLMGDALIDKINQGIYARLPLGGTSAPSGGNGGPDQDALSLIGTDRVIVQGIGEKPLAYGKRLQRAFPTWQHAGQAITVMQEVLAYLQTSCKIAVVATLGQSFSGAPIAHFTSFASGADPTLPPSRWTGGWWWDTGYGYQFSAGQQNAYDGHPYDWHTAVWRDWLVLWSVTPNDWADAAPAFGSGIVIGDPRYSIGLSVPSSVIKTVRALVGTWKCASTWYRWIIVSLDANFADWGSGSAYYPATGDWQRWSKVVNQQYVPARAPNLRYCDGVINAGSV